MTLFHSVFSKSTATFIAAVLCLCVAAAPTTWAGDKPSKKVPTASEQRLERVNINKASIPQLTQLTGVGEKKAIAIVKYRNKHGKFRSIDQLADVSGIGEKIVEKNRLRLAI